MKFIYIQGLFCSGFYCLRNYCSWNSANIYLKFFFQNTTLIQYCYTFSMNKLLKSIKYLVVGYNLILKINFQINFSWLPTKWRSTIYGTYSKNFTIICVNLRVSASYMDPYTSLIMEVFKGEKKSNENYNY